MFTTETILAIIIRHLYNALDNRSILNLGSTSRAIYAAWTEISAPILANCEGKLLRDDELDILNMDIPSMSYIEGASFELLFNICAKKIKTTPGMKCAFISVPYCMKTIVFIYVNTCGVNRKGAMQLSLMLSPEAKVERNGVYFLIDQISSGWNIQGVSNPYYVSMVPLMPKSQKVAIVQGATTIYSEIEYNISLYSYETLHEIITSLTKNDDNYIILMKRNSNTYHNAFYYNDLKNGIIYGNKVSTIIIVFNCDITEKILATIRHTIHTVCNRHNQNTIVRVQFVCMGFKYRLLAGMLKKDLETSFKEYNQTYERFMCIADNGGSLTPI